MTFGRAEPMPYAEAFDSVLRAAFDHLAADGSADSHNRRGSLRPGDPASYAVGDAYRYHRAHRDTFVWAVDHFGVAAEGDESIAVLDLGAGAGTVAAALVEQWGPFRPRAVHYCGVEPHPTMRQLGGDLLGLIAPAWLSHSFRPTVCGWEPPRSDRYLVTLSYVVHQPALADEDLKRWARACSDLAKEGPTDLLLTTAISSKPAFTGLDRTQDLLTHLEQAGLSVSAERAEARIPQRFPSPAGGWTTGQRAGTADWKNVQARHWSLEVP